MSSASDARVKINEFDQRSSGTDWLKIQKDQLVDGMKKRLDNPNLINTQVVNLCGPVRFSAAWPRMTLSCTCERSSACTRRIRA